MGLDNKYNIQEILNAVFNRETASLNTGFTFSGDVEIGAVEIKNGADDTRAVVGFANSAVVGGLALNVADANVKADTAALVTSIQLLDDTIYVDDSAFVAASGKVQTVGFFANETTPDSVTEGDVAAPRVTLDRRIITAGQTTDDAAPETGTRVNLMGALFDDTATDSVDEGDAGFIRMTSERKLITAGSYVDDTAITPAGANTYGVLLGAMADETGPDSVDEGDFGALRMTLTRFLKTSLGDLLSGEDQTNNVLQVVEKPLGVSTYTPDLDTSAALEASSVTKASAGVLYGFTASNTNATGHWIQFFNSTTVPVDTTVPVLEFFIPGEGTVAYEWPKGRNFATGIAWCISSTNGAKTIAGATALADVNYK